MRRDRSRGARLRAVQDPRRRSAGRGDRLFAALDNRRIEGGEGGRIQVTGIHIDGHDTWIQVNIAATPPFMVLLRLSLRATPQHVLAALCAWIDLAPAVRPTRIDVMCLASVHRDAG
jgi:hypothetical protein